MPKKGLPLASLRVNNGAVVIYYNHIDMMRLPTGVTISKKKRNKKFVDWDYIRQTVSANIENADTIHASLQGALNNANEILKEHYLQNISLTGSELKEIIIQRQSEKKLKRSALLLDMYREFHQQKNEDLKIRGNIISLKDYTSFLNVLIDYEAVHGTRIKITEVNENFCRSLMNWLQTKAPKSVDTSTGKHYLKTKGNLSPKTLKKRFDIFKEFFKFLQTNGFIENYEFLKNYSRKIQNVTTEKVTLSVEEVFKLYDFEFDDVRLNKIRDLFTFTCLTGLRWGDLESFNPDFIRDVNGHPVYKKIAQKTARSSGVIMDLPLCADAMAILKKNGMSLKPLITGNVQANRDLKDALRQTGLFNQLTNIKDDKTGEYLRRHEAITMHKGRDTFITNLVSITPLNELMRYTGHNKIVTLQKYIDQTRPINPTYIKTAFTRQNNEQAASQ